MTANIIKVWGVLTFFVVVSCGGQIAAKPAPTFSLSITLDSEAINRVPGLVRVVVKYTNVGDELAWRQYQPEAKGMYDMEVLRDGKPVRERPALLELRAYRKVDDNPHLNPDKVFKPGESWYDILDVSDYYDMTDPGNYEIAIARATFPYSAPYSVVVRSNTITMHLSSRNGAGRTVTQERPPSRFDLFLSKMNSASWPPVLVEVTRQNISKETIREAKCWSFLGMYHIHVLRDGDELKGNFHLEDLERRRSAMQCNANETLREIPPGKTDADEFAVSNFFDLSAPGSYVIYVTRETEPWIPAKSRTVESNTVGFVVSEQPRAHTPEPMSRSTPP